MLKQTDRKKMSIKKGFFCGYFGFTSTKTVLIKFQSIYEYIQLVCKHSTTSYYVRPLWIEPLDEKSAKIKLEIGATTQDSHEKDIKLRLEDSFEL